MMLSSRVGWLEVCFVLCISVLGPARRTDSPVLNFYAQVSTDGRKRLQMHLCLHNILPVPRYNVKTQICEILVAE